MITAERAFEIDEEGKWKKKIPEAQQMLIERYQRLDELIKKNNFVKSACKTLNININAENAP